jgi:hypothetical protein
MAFSGLGLLGQFPIMPGAISICDCLRAVHEGAAKTDHAVASGVARILPGSAISTVPAILWHRRCTSRVELLLGGVV